ncbi:MAG: glutamate ligase domain-containing protein [Evtepia gabavorous]
MSRSRCRGAQCEKRHRGGGGGAPFRDAQPGRCPGAPGFPGAGRRFEYKGTVKGAAVYDDYAHHPGELKALLETAASLGYQRVICAFQPHTYTRTKALFSEFAAVLQQADVTFLAEIFAAREKNEVGISSQDLAAAVPGARAAKNFDQLTQWLYDLARPGI